VNEQNIYDNQDFFDGYMKLRSNVYSANTIVEQPAFFSLCPDFAGKNVLDLGCGFGENCRKYSELGAKSVVGLDISKKMLAVAEQENKMDRINYICMSMSDLKNLTGHFDIVLSSLAVHYIEDFDEMLSNIFRLLAPEGVLIFSQEHPLTTALKGHNYWTRDENGNMLHYNLTDYGFPGERSVNWLVDGIIKYHRSFSSIINSLVEAGFLIQKVLEPVPDEQIVKQTPAYGRFYHKPDFLVIKAKKKC